MIGLPVILLVVLVASVVLKLFPILSMFAGGGSNYVLTVVKMVERVTGFRPNPVKVPFPFEAQKVLLAGAHGKLKKKRKRRW